MLFLAPSHGWYCTQQLWSFQRKRRNGFAFALPSLLIRNVEELRVWPPPPSRPPGIVFLTKSGVDDSGRNALLDRALVGCCWISCGSVSASCSCLRFRVRVFCVLIPAYGDPCTDDTCFDWSLLPPPVCCDWRVRTLVGGLEVSQTSHVWLVTPTPDPPRRDWCMQTPEADSCIQPPPETDWRVTPTSRYSSDQAKQVKRKHTYIPQGDRRTANTRIN